MFTIKTLNAISPVGLSKLATNQFEVLVECPDPDGILVRSANMHEMELGKNLKAIARAGAGVNNIPLDKCAAKRALWCSTPPAPTPTPWPSWCWAA